MCVFPYDIIPILWFSLEYGDEHLSVRQPREIESIKTHFERRFRHNSDCYFPKLSTNVVVFWLWKREMSLKLLIMTSLCTEF